MPALSIFSIINLPQSQDFLELISLGGPHLELDMHGRLQLIEPTEPRSLRQPFDFFLRSLAQDQRENAIGIILSGTGTGGTLGLKAIKGEGGLVMVQDIESAKYDGMPKSAIDMGLADYILPAREMPLQLMKYVKYSHIRHIREDKAPDALQKVFIILRNQTGHDFSLYKQNTIMSLNCEAGRQAKK
ncbi:MAG: chemotaxis protein CheB [bacterium]|nr:chemotaxis protein CheB [bacterium]